MSVLTRMAINSVLIFVVSSGLLLNMDAAVAQTEANDTIERYMNALITGDVETVKQCLGKGLQDRNRNTFNDPTYSNFLINQYNGATYRIVQSRERKNGKTIVDVEIIFKDKKTMMIRLLLNSSNKIIDEVLL